MTAGTARSVSALPLILGAGLLAALALATAPLTITMEKADPSFYLSYVLDYPAISARFGQTYHGNRLSYLLVDRAAFALLGPEVGYFAARWLALTVAVLATVGIAAPRLGRAAALSVGAAVALTPWLPRQLLWVHYDGFAVTYVLVAAWLLLGPTGRRWRPPAAGAALALAVNANLGIAVLAAGAVLGWWVATGGPTRHRARGVVSIAAGFVAVEAVLSVVLRLMVGSGPWFVETVAIRVALFLAGDDNSWFEPLPAVLRSSPQLLLVPAVGLLALVVARRRPAPQDRPDAALLGGVWLLSSGAAVLVLHVGLESAWLSNRFYVVQFLPLLVVGLVGVAAAAVRGAGADAGWAQWVAPFGVAGVLGALWTRAALVPAAAPAAALAVVALAVVALRRGGAPRALVGGLVAAVLAATVGAPAQAVGSAGWADLAERERFEWAVFHHLRDVQALVERRVPTDRDLVFWHRTDGPEGEWLRRINMAYYGTGGGRLHRDAGDGPGMPGLEAGQLDELAQRAPITVVLLGVERSEVTAGLVALSAAVPGARQVAQDVLPGDVFDVHVALVEVG